MSSEIKEKWRDVFTPEQLARLQQLEFKELLAVKKVCEKLNIHFFLYGGTLLGAYKYKGFIPWDDDVDIAMDRESYEKFVMEAPKILPSDFIIQNPLVDPKSPYSYTKLRLKGTRCIEEFNHELDIEQGIYIDIYPVDNIPDNENQYKKQFKKIQSLLSIISHRQQNPRRFFKTMIFLRAFKHFLFCCFYRSVPIKLWMRVLKKEMTRYNADNTKRKTCWHYPNDKNYYEPLFPLIKVSFNGEEFMAPNDMEDHLVRRYGNIQQLPPYEKRIGHYIHILDFGQFKNKDPQ